MQHLRYSLCCCGYEFVQILTTLLFISHCVSPYSDKLQQPHRIVSKMVTIHWTQWTATPGERGLTLIPAASSSIILRHFQVMSTETWLVKKQVLLWHLHAPEQRRSSALIVADSVSTGDASSLIKYAALFRRSPENDRIPIPHTARKTTLDHVMHFAGVILWHANSRCNGALAMLNSLIESDLGIVRRLRKIYEPMRHPNEG